MVNGLMVGPGDMSELALGFTYGGDHAGMYASTAACTKRYPHMAWRPGARTRHAGRAGAADILDTPVSPELLPPRTARWRKKPRTL